jgi:tetratricopeptide (TPR) repeat protein
MSVCKFRQEQDGPIAEAMNMLKQVFVLLDQGELLPHLLTGTSSSNGGGRTGAGSMDTDSLDAYIVESLCDDLDLLKQLMRTALELVRIGANTRAQKVLTFLETCLHSLSRKQIVSQHADPALDMSASERALLRSKVERDIPSLWCQLASACETLGRPAQALAAYQAALQINAHHAVSLTEYAHLARTERAPADVAAVRALLQQHIEARIKEFADLKSEQQGGPGFAPSTVQSKS